MSFCLWHLCWFDIATLLTPCRFKIMTLDISEYQSKNLFLFGQFQVIVIIYQYYLGDSQISVHIFRELIRKILRKCDRWHPWCHTATLSKSLMVTHQIVFKIYREITGRWNVGHADLYLFWGQRLGHSWSHYFEVKGWVTLSESMTVIHQIVFKILLACVEVLRPCQQLRSCRASQLPIYAVTRQAQTY